MLEDRTVQQDDRFGFTIGSVAEVEDVSVGPQAAHDAAAGWGRKSLALESNGNFAVIADAYAGALAPDVGPPRAGGSGPQHGAFFGEGLLPCGVRGDGQLAVDFVLIGVGEELVEQVVGPVQFENAVGHQQRGQSFLPVVVAALDLAFGLGRGGVAQGHAVEVQRGTELGEGIRVVGEEEGMVVHIEGQRQAVGEEDAGEEVEVGQEGFAVVEASPEVVAGGVVEEIEQDLLVRTVRQPRVRAGVVLPEGAQIAGLPAFDGLGGFFVAGVRGQLVFQCPAADAGAVGLKAQAAVEFAGGGAVGGRGFGGEKFGQQSDDIGGPVRVMVAAGGAWSPGVGLAASAGAQVVEAQSIETARADAQFGGDRAWGKMAGAGLGKEVADQRSRNTMEQLELFILGRIAEVGGFGGRCPPSPLGLIAWGPIPVGCGLSGRPQRRPDLAYRLPASRRCSGCVPAEPYPPLEKVDTGKSSLYRQQKNDSAAHFSCFDRTGFPVLIAPRQMTNRSQVKPYVERMEE